MWWKASLGLLLAIGIGIATVSIYKASVDGLLKQVGMYGSDFNVSVMRHKLTDIRHKAQSTLSCDLPSRLQGTVRYMLSGDDRQGELAFRLGQDRIVCGATMLSKGDVEVGTYEIIKGMGYLSQGYAFVSERILIDRRACQGLPDNQADVVVGRVLEATSGRVYEIIWEEWNRVQDVRLPVESSCLDQRQDMR